MNLPEPLDELAEYTVDQLAHSAGIPTSTVRLYQNKGILDPPIKRGRVGIYGIQHRRRLTRIAALQQRGFSLAAIKDVLDGWEKGQSLGDLMRAHNDAPSLKPATVRRPLAQVIKSFSGAELSQQDFQRARDLGLLQISDSDAIVNPVFLEVGSLLTKLGIPATVILDEYEKLQPTIATIVDQFEEVFMTHIWAQPATDEPTGKNLNETVERVETLAFAAEKIVSITLREQFIQLAERHLDTIETQRNNDETTEG